MAASRMPVTLLILLGTVIDLYEFCALFIFVSTQVSVMIPLTEELPNKPSLNEDYIIHLYQ